jgi:hypothetical protein
MVCALARLGVHVDRKEKRPYRTGRHLRNKKR